MKTSVLKHKTRNSKAISETKFRDICEKYLGLNQPQAKSPTPEVNVPANALRHYNKTLYLTLPKLQLKETANFINTNISSV